MAEIIKLEKYLEKHLHNVLAETMTMLGMDPENASDMKYTKKLFAEAANSMTPTEQHNLETEITLALSEQDADAIRFLLGLNEVTWENDSMNYVDVSEGYNFRCLVNNNSARETFMDWLEEGGYDYLIDNDGRFAIKCPTREIQYHVNRQLESFSNKWDRPSQGQNVDPDVRRKTLLDPSRPALEGDVVQGPWTEQPPQEDPLEPGPAYAAQGMDPETLFGYAYNILVDKVINGVGGSDMELAIESVEQDLKQELTSHQKRNLVSKFEQEFGSDVAIQQAFKNKTAGPNVIVDDSVEEDERDSAFKDTTHSLSPLGHQPNEGSGHFYVGDSVWVPGFSGEDEEGTIVGVGADPLDYDVTVELKNGDRISIDSAELQIIENDLDEIAKQFTALEGKTKTAKQRERAAKEKLEKMKSAEQGIAVQGMRKNKQAAGVHTTKKGKKGYDKKAMRQKQVDETNFVDVLGSSEEATPILNKWMEKINEEFDGDPIKSYIYLIEFFQQKIRAKKTIAHTWALNELKRSEFLSENLNEGVLGTLTMMPNLDRIKQLAGINATCSPDSSMMTVTSKPTGDPGTPIVQELPGVAEARELMAKAFSVYENLDGAQQEIFKKFMIDNLMGATVKESFNESDLMELIRRDKGPKGEPLSDNERISIAEMLNKHWRGLVVDIESWKNRTSELKQVELVIITLRKVAGKIGKGLV